MIQVGCINKIKDTEGVVTHYVLQDKNGKCKILNTKQLKNAIKGNIISCMNLKVTSNDEIVDKDTWESINNFNKLTPVEMYNRFKEDVIAKKDAEYEVNGDNVLLKKVLIKSGTFTIPPFVTGLKRYKDKKGYVVCNVFKECEKLKLINKSQITNMSHMFSNCENLQELDLSEFDTSKVNDMSYMFSECPELGEFDLSNFNTSKVTNMEGMFEGCIELYSITLENFDTSQVTNMKHMFAYCNTMEYCDLNSFNTSKVTNMSGMFGNCIYLRKLNIHNFNISNVKNKKNILCGCWELKDFDAPKGLQGDYQAMLYRKSCASDEAEVLDEFTDTIKPRISKELKNELKDELEEYVGEDNKKKSSDNIFGLGKIDIPEQLVKELDKHLGNNGDESFDKIFGPEKK